MDRFNNALPEDDERKDGKSECSQCLKLEDPETMAELNSNYFCAACLDPMQPAYFAVVGIVDWMAAEIKTLRVERQRLMESKG